MRLEMSNQEATILDDILGMWIEAADEEVPSLAASDEEAHWCTLQMRRTRDTAAKLRMRIACERRDNPE